MYKYLHPNPKYTTPLLRQYSSPYFCWSKKRELNEFKKWMAETYPTTYADVKEGDCFILHNGDSVPVPFIQLKDERPDKTNRPTRLLDGSYLTLQPDMRVAITTKEVVAALKKEIMVNY